jgi:hypothetical protein
MDGERSKEEELFQQILLQEFKLWDAKRNNVCQKYLDDMQDKINELRVKVSTVHSVSLLQ